MRTVLTLICGLCLAVASSNILAGQFAETGVSFQTTDSGLQRLFGSAEKKAAENITQFTPEMKILVEGGGYPRYTV